ncbi:hypothetical protein PC116_g11295 [Phytophthora cactorum]|nr:hypothetical protein PC116_g11295 [Phytophthora cactorum]
MAVLHGVRHFFAASGYKFTIAHPYIRILLKGISRLDSSRRRKAPVSLNLLGECVSNLSMAEPFELALWGVMCLAFFFLLRRSEVVAISGSTFKWFAVRSQDIAVLNAQRHPPQEHNRSMCVSCGPRPTKVEFRQHGCCLNQVIPFCAPCLVSLFCFRPGEACRQTFPLLFTWTGMEFRPASQP